MDGDGKERCEYHCQKCDYDQIGEELSYRMDWVCANGLVRKNNSANIHGDVRMK
jgi:hypothetical protein